MVKTSDIPQTLEECEAFHKRLFDIVIKAHYEHINANPSVPFDNRRLNELHGEVFKLCTNTSYNSMNVDHTERLAEDFTKHVEYVLSTYIVSHLVSSKSKDDVTFLKAWSENFRKYTIFIKGLHIVYYYLNYNRKESGKRRTLIETCYHLFQEKVYAVFGAQVRQCVASVIRSYRDGTDVDKALIADVCKSVLEISSNLEPHRNDLDKKLSLYRELNTVLLQDVTKYYQERVQEWMSTLHFGEYVNTIKEAFDFELDRVVNLMLLSDSAASFRVELHNILVKTQLEELLSRPGAIEYFLSPDNTEKLGLLYYLAAADEQSVHVLGDQLKAHLIHCGTQLVTSIVQKQNNNTPPANIGNSPVHAKSPPGGGGAANTANTTSTGSNAIQLSGLITSLIDLNHRYESIVMTRCEGNQYLRDCLNSAFQAFINNDKNVSSLLADYVHLYMSGKISSVTNMRASGTGTANIGMKGVSGATGTTGNIAGVGGASTTGATTISTSTSKYTLGTSMSSASASDFSSFLMNIGSLFNYIREKDAYQDPHRKYLAERLLNDTTIGINEERLLVSKLHEKGATGDWKDKTTSMILDIEKSMVLSKKFSDCASGFLDTHELRYDVKICTRAHWGNVFKETSGNLLPPVLRKLVEETTKYYHSLDPAYVQHKVKCQLDLGTADIHISYESGTKLLVVSTIMLVVLYYLDEMTSQSNVNFIIYKDLLARMGVTPDSEDEKLIKHHILCLTEPKFRVLVKSTLADRNNVGLNEKLMIPKDVNEPYKPVTRIVIPLKPMVTSEQTKQERVDIMKGRQRQYEAAIVRLLKSRKEMKYHELQREVFAQITHFTPEIAGFKEALDETIVKEYIKRDEDDNQKFIYMA